MSSNLPTPRTAWAAAIDIKQVWGRDPANGKPANGRRPARRGGIKGSLRRGTVAIGPLKRYLVSTMADPDSPNPPDALGRLAASLGEIGRGKGPPPVERWNPPFCGDIDMRIDADGTWFYMGTPIGRPALVRLFASVLRRDPDRFVLVTPVERVGIAVADAPFLAVAMEVDGTGDTRRVAFRTNVDDLVDVGPDHPLRFDEDETGGVRPYLRVRGGLWAKVTRALTYDLVDLGETRPGEDGAELFGLAVAGAFYPIPAPTA